MHVANETDETKQRDIELYTDANQFLTFSLGDEEYGVDILKVQEIKGYVRTTRIPNSPPEITGVLNLRGTIVPIVDLRRKFGLPVLEYDQFTAIVVVVVQGKVMGMIVDSVSEVVSIPPSDIQLPPELGNSLAPSLLRGMARMGEKLIILLDIEQVMLGDGYAMAA
jgi:purine-binding chemotaxis protein CheW